MSAFTHTRRPSSAFANLRMMRPFQPINGIQAEFDLLDVLAKVEFPNDRAEKLLRREKKYRTMALRRIPFSLSAESGTSPLSFEFEKEFSVSGRHLCETDAQGRRISFQNIKNPQIVEKLNLDQLSRAAAAVIIQSTWRSFSARRKFADVVIGAISNLTLPQASSNTSENDSLNKAGGKEEDHWRLQEAMLKKFDRWCRDLERVALFAETFAHTSSKGHARFPNLEESFHKPSSARGTRIGTAGARTPHTASSHKEAAIVPIPPEYPQFCAVMIQSYWRMVTLRKGYLAWRQENRGRGGTKEEFLKSIERKRKKLSATFKLDEPATKIQRAWKRQYNIRIYHFYRDLIKFRERGDPRRLLKFINPTESQLIDAAAGIHVRFRLGGTSFPPTIYYKIFIHNAMIDLNAFAPRNYGAYTNNVAVARLQHNNVRIIRTEDLKGKKEKHKEGWYMRVENNGWRPVADKIWAVAKEDPNEFHNYLSRMENPNEYQKPIPFHYSKLKRRQEIMTRRKDKKLLWFLKMYDQAKSEGRTHLSLEESLATFEKGQMEDSINFEARETPLRRTEESPDDADDDGNLLAWSRALDFDRYQNNWLSLATTGRSEDPSSFMFDDSETTNQNSDALLPCDYFDVRSENGECHVAYTQKQIQEMLAG